MGTRLYFNDLTSNYTAANKREFMWTSGRNDSDLRSSAVGWQHLALESVRGGGVTSQTTTSVNGATPGLETGLTGTGPCQWCSAPIARDVTISGTITFNLRMAESSMSANASAACQLLRVDSTGAITEFCKIVRGVELGTSEAAENFTGSPTSTDFKRGDRILARPFFDDAGTMATGFTLTFWHRGANAGASGESYFELTEVVTFEVDEVGADITPGTGLAGSNPVGSGATTLRRAAMFRPQNQGTLTSVDIQATRSGTPTDNYELALQADSSGLPSNTDLASASVSGTSITAGVKTNVNFDLGDTVLDPTATYWLVLRRSGSADAANFWSWHVDQPIGNSAQTTFDTSAWTTVDPQIGPAFEANVTHATTTLYLTTTAGPAVGADNEKEMWTSRGSGSTTATKTPVAGWTAPLRLQISSTDAEWYSRQLQAFTLSGPIDVNCWGQRSASSNSHWRAEIAVCNGDGTGATVWGATTTGIALAGSDSQYRFLVTGDDVAVTDGQRIRLRFFTDDGGTFGATAMAASGTDTLNYASPTGGVSGDTYIVLPAAVVEYVPPAVIPHVAMARFIS